MGIRCPDCGRDNAATAKFCAGCGRAGLQATVPTAPHSVAAARPQAHPAVSPQLIEQPGAQPLAPHSASPLTSSGQTSLATGQPPNIGTPAGLKPVQQQRRQHYLVAGHIEQVNETSVPPPRDISWIAVRLAVLAALLPVVLSFFAGIGLAIVVVILLGGWVILTVFGALAAAFGRLIGLMLPKGRARDRDTIQAHFVVEEPGGDQYEVLLYGDHVGGRLHKGDHVEVYGRRRRDGAIRARRVCVVGVQFARGNVQRRTVRGTMGLPAAVALVAWVAALVVWVYFYLPVLIPLIQS